MYQKYCRLNIKHSAIYKPEFKFFDFSLVPEMTWWMQVTILVTVASLCSLLPSIVDAKNSDDVPDSLKNDNLVAYLSHIAKSNRRQMIDQAGPYGERKLKKRNGEDVWLWVPSQGFVSVPVEEANGAGANNGKLMRYGRRR